MGLVRDEEFFWIRQVKADIFRAPRSKFVNYFALKEKETKTS